MVFDSISKLTADADVRSLLLDPETVNDPVITASPENGNASTPVNEVPSPTNDPEKDPVSPGDISGVP